ncbi:MAG: glycosyltransferase, partial [Alphaproteobacteria bacterium]|nr:glycosyltransferase [Alphaproteobacteria bacterium]
MICLKVLHIVEHMDMLWSHRLPLAEGARACGHEVTIAAPGARENQRLRVLGFQTADLPALAASPAGLLRVMDGIHALLRIQKPDLVHVFTLKYVFAAGLVLRFHRNITPVYSIAGLGWLFRSGSLKAHILRILISPFLRFALNNPRARIIVQNPDDLSLLIQGRMAQDSRCHLIRGSGVDTRQFSYTEEPADGIPMTLMPTRLLHGKGVTVFARAARLLKDRGVRARFCIAGGLSPGNPDALTAEEMKAMTADGALEWLGKVA